MDVVVENEGRRDSDHGEDEERNPLRQCFLSECACRNSRTIKSHYDWLVSCLEDYHVVHCSLKGHIQVVVNRRDDDLPRAAAPFLAETTSRSLASTLILRSGVEDPVVIHCGATVDVKRHQLVFGGVQLADRAQGRSDFRAVLFDDSNADGRPTLEKDMTLLTLAESQPEPSPKRVTELAEAWLLGQDADTLVPASMSATAQVSLSENQVSHLKLQKKQNKVAAQQEKNKTLHATKSAAPTVRHKPRAKRPAPKPRVNQLTESKRLRVNSESARTLHEHQHATTQQLVQLQVELQVLLKQNEELKQTLNLRREAAGVARKGLKGLVQGRLQIAYMAEKEPEDMASLKAMRVADELFPDAAGHDSL